MFERATRLCNTSPQIATVRPLTRPLRRRIVSASSSAWVGCSWLPSPALITEQSTFSESSCTAPDSGWRTTSTSGCIAFKVIAVSINVSPLRIEETATAMLMTSAPSRLPATSNEVRVRVVAPRTLLPAAVERLGVEVFYDMRRGLADADIVMMLRLQMERMHGSFVPSTREYFHFFGLDYDKLKLAKPDALIMHPGPMNRGVEIGSEVADDIDRSLIRQQVEMGVAVRMACLEVLTASGGNNPPVH